VRDVEVVDDSFDARHSALSRRYRYQVLASPVPDPALAAQAWHIDSPLNLAAMRLACDPLVGEHDFASFCRRPRRPAGEPAPSLVRRVLDARWEEGGDEVLRLWIEANTFCHQMVRSIVGTMVEVGMGKRTAGDLATILRQADRAAVSLIAPPHGLSLWSVQY
jgi:tRNA pseudouridine38-40 synthase